MTDARILFPFQTDLPTPAEALDALYDAFSAYSNSAEPMCAQCFDPPVQLRVREIADPRRAALSDIGMLYYEHPNCVGESRFRFFLPRVVEVGFWEEYELIERLTQMGVWSLSESEQAALRQAFSVAAVGWFTRGDPAPLAAPPPCPFCGKNCEERIIIGEMLLTGLFLFRVDPFTVFPWLAGLGTPRADMALAESFPDGAYLPEESYHWPIDDTRDAQIAAAKAINERIVMAASAAVSPEDLSAMFFKYADSHREIAKLASETLELDAQYRAEIDEAALAKGLPVIAAGLVAATR